MTSPSPSDITLLISLDVCHRAVAVAKRFNSHQIIATVTCLPSFVEVGKGRHYICQRTEVTLRLVILGRRGTQLSKMLHTKFVFVCTALLLWVVKYVRACHLSAFGKQ